MIKTIAATAIFLTAMMTAFGAQAQSASATPSLKGAWQASAQMHHKNKGHAKPEGMVSKMEVLSQEGRVFHGTLVWNHSKSKGNETFSGVIDKDEKTFYIAGHTEGIRIGKMDGSDAFTFYILVPGGTNPRAGLAEFKRIK
jgi:hypothetical protein